MDPKKFTEHWKLRVYAIARVSLAMYVRFARLLVTRISSSFVRVSLRPDGGPIAFVLLSCPESTKQIAILLASYVQVACSMISVYASCRRFSWKWSTHAISSTPYQQQSASYAPFWQRYAVIFRQIASCLVPTTPAPTPIDMETSLLLEEDSNKTPNGDPSSKNSTKTYFSGRKFRSLVVLIFLKICILLFLYAFSSSGEGPIISAVISLLSHNVSTASSEVTSTSTSIPSSIQPLCGYAIRSLLSGGLGNQMFAYASFYGLVTQYASKSPKKTPFVRAWRIPSELDVVFEKISLPQTVLNDSWFDGRNVTNLGERACCLYDNSSYNKMEICDGYDIHVTGYRQSYKYFSHVFEDIRREFTFKKSIIEKATTMIQRGFTEKKLSQDDCVRVGVHLRRGDFASADKQDFGHSPARIDYLQRAVTFFETQLYSGNVSKKATCIAFLVFGNEKEWNFNATQSLKLQRPNQTHFLLFDANLSDASTDLCALSMCDHALTSAGTFSWWAGFFSRGIVTYQKEYARVNSSLIKQYVREDFFPPSWVPL